MCHIVQCLGRIQTWGLFGMLPAGLFFALQGMVCILRDVPHQCPKREGSGMSSRRDEGGGSVEELAVAEGSGSDSELVGDPAVWMRFMLVGLVWVNIGDEDEVNGQVKGNVCVGILSTGDKLGVTSSELEEWDSLVSGDDSEAVHSICPVVRNVPTEYG
ncbi:hypothetical protein P691DRAFT_790495 [Macrolepiota fuliginosa MF-IS2]|uniref:Uncharacterized protein n=1 Tax=Macrolepiota fuliginosa MF-IS2 TaxID=1400762 RepID=A0A9P5X236_9AGAR|nr:hypothetical protein P691DRAFT_790495 [Macrolepiota fuliginosa MF-IS2]